MKWWKRSGKSKRKRLSWRKNGGGRPRIRLISFRRTSIKLGHSKAFKKSWLC